jgi:hypothetical protein
LKKRAIPPSNKLAFCNQTFVQRPPLLFRSTEDDDDDNVDDGDPVSSPFARMVRKTAEEAEKLVCGGEVQLR